MLETTLTESLAILPNYIYPEKIKIFFNSKTMTQALVALREEGKYSLKFHQISEQTP